MRAVATGAIAATGVGAMAANAKADRPERSKFTYEVSNVSCLQVGSGTIHIIGKPSDYFDGDGLSKIEMDMTIKMDGPLYETFYKGLKNPRHPQIKADVDAELKLCMLGAMRRIGFYVALGARGTPFKDFRNEKWPWTGRFEKFTMPNKTVPAPAK